MIALSAIIFSNLALLPQPSFSAPFPGEITTFSQVYKLSSQQDLESGPVKAAPFWTGRQALALGGVMSCIILAGFGWVLSLRRQVRLQTAAIQKEKNLLATLIDHLPDNVYVKDLQGRYALTNLAHARFHGAPSPNYFRGKSGFDLFSQDRAQVFAEADRKILSGDMPVFTCEEEVTNGKSQRRLLATTKVPLKDQAGRIIGLVGFSRDVTEARLAEQELRRDISERRRVESVLAYERDLLSALFENIPDALYFKDLQSRFVRVSKSKLESSWAMARARHRFQQAAQNPRADNQRPAQESASPGPPPYLASRDAFAEYIIGKTDFDFFAEPRARSAFEDEQQIVRSGQPLIGKVEQTNHLDGRVTWSLTTKMPWRDKDGHLIGTFGVSKDITAIKEAEASLEIVHKQLLDASRQAGMAEVATGVLHNVGNVLNSVNVSANLLSEKLRHSRVSGLAKVVALLREHSSGLADFITNDRRGRQLPVYLEQLAERVAEEQALLVSEVSCLARNLEHIKSIVAMQQAYAKPGGITESVQAVDLVEDALRINGGALARHHVQIVREYESQLPTLNVDKHKVLQILVNLVSNAGHACAQSQRGDKRLTVRLGDRHNRIQFAIADNGIGIAPENLTRIFSLGFTTRSDGHGFGLHSGALAANELGGTLRSHSDGFDRGATFILELPVAPPV